VNSKAFHELSQFIENTLNQQNELFPDCFGGAIDQIGTRANA
jgi:hypothetical protein